MGGSRLPLGKGTCVPPARSAGTSCLRRLPASDCAIYADRLGWFDGNATRLFPLAEGQRAAKIIGLAGGADQVLARARDALRAREFQWAAELADYVLAVDSVNGDAKRIKGQA